MTTALELAQAWSRWIDAKAWYDRIGSEVAYDRTDDCFDAALALNAQVLEAEAQRQYAEDAVRLSGEMSAGAER